MRYKLVALDLDGTLLSDEKAISEDTLRLINEAQRNGVLFTVATGRMRRGAIRYAHQLGVDIPIITYNGALVSCPVTNRVYRQFNLPVSGALDVLALLKEETLLRYLFLNDDVYTDSRHEWTDRYAELLNVEMNFVDDIGLLIQSEPTMLVFMVPTQNALGLAQILKSKLDSQVRITNSTEWFLDILHPRATKGVALKYVADYLGIAREEVIAIGDNLNDLEMIEYAGKGIAVANATDGLKSAADYITELPANKGVEEAIQKFIL